MTSSLQLYEQASTVATLESQMGGTMKMELHQKPDNFFTASNNQDQRRLITPKKIEDAASCIDIQDSGNDVDLNCEESY